jgi:hypothetical protein
LPTTAVSSTTPAATRCSLRNSAIDDSGPTPHVVSSGEDPCWYRCPHKKAEQRSRSRGSSVQTCSRWLDLLCTQSLDVRRHRSYLVGDRQKADLAQRVRRGRYIRLLLLLPMFAPLIAVIVVERVPPWLQVSVFTVVFTVVINLCDYFVVRKVLVGVPRTSQRIGPIEMQGRQARSMSVKALITIEALACAFFSPYGPSHRDTPLYTDRGRPLWPSRHSRRCSSAN